MDDNRIVTGLTESQRASPGVPKSVDLRNDLEDSGQLGYETFPEERRRERERRRQRRPQSRTVEDELPSELVAELDRIRQTDEEVEQEAQDLKRLRGRFHYREKEPETSRFYRRKDKKRCE